MDMITGPAFCIYNWPEELEYIKTKFKFKQKCKIMRIIVRIRFNTKRVEYESKSLSVRSALAFMRWLAVNKPADLESANIVCESMTEAGKLTNLMLEAANNTK